MLGFVGETFIGPIMCLGDIENLAYIRPSFASPHLLHVIQYLSLDAQFWSFPVVAFDKQPSFNLASISRGDAEVGVRPGFQPPVSHGRGCAIGVPVLKNGVTSIMGFWPRRQILPTPFGLKDKGLLLLVGR